MLSSLLIVMLLFPQQYNHPFAPRAAGGASTPLDWTASFNAVWLLEEASGTRANETSTICGSSCDFSDNNTVTQDTTHYIEGSAGASVLGTNNEYLSATSFDTLPGTGDFSVGMWFYNSGSDDIGNILTFLDAQADGIYIQNHSGNNQIGCYLDGASTLTSPDCDGEWCHVACTYANDADDEVNLYIDGAAASSPGTLTSRNSYQGNNNRSVPDYRSAFDIDATFDEVWSIADTELTGAQIARIAACGVDGTSGPCTCSGTSWTSKGRVDANCTAADNPYDCCTGNGTGCIDDALITGDCNEAAP